MFSRLNTTSRESVSKTDERIDKLADQLSTLVEIVSKKVVTPAPVKAVEEICVTCSGPHATGTYNQVNPPNRVSNQMAPPGFAPVQNNGQNKREKLLEFAIIIVERELLGVASSKSFPKSWGSGKFLFHVISPGMVFILTETLHQPGWTLEIRDRSLTHPKDCAEEVFVKSWEFSLSYDFDVVDFEAILGFLSF
ncbi:hypothetical protein Tco_0378781 [Tanacetum coccineum]